MKVIYKYSIAAKIIKIDMPKGAEILKVDEQGGEPYLWALVETENKDEERLFDTYGTGDEIPGFYTKYHFVGTYYLHSGKFVFHVFELSKI